MNHTRRKSTNLITSICTNATRHLNLKSNLLLASLLISPYSTYAAHISVIDRTSSTYAYTNNYETGYSENLQESFAQSGPFVSELQTTTGMYVRQSSTTGEKGITFDSTWQYTGYIAYGSVDVSSEMAVTFDLGQDSLFNMSWISEGLRRAPQQQQMSGNQRFILTRSGDSTPSFFLLAEYFDTVQVYTMYGSLLGAPDRSMCSGCPSPQNGSLEGTLLSGQYTLTLQNLSRGGSGVESRYASNSNMSFNMQITAVPLPASIWLFGSALIGLAGFIRKK